MIKIYLAGPIDDVPEGNKPLFNKLETEWNSCPRILAFNPHKIKKPKGFEPTWYNYMRLCVPVLMSCDAIAMLPGWEKSSGATKEKAIAEMFNFKVYDAMHPSTIPRPLPTPPITEEAQRLVQGARQGAYGPPERDFARTAGMLTALLGFPVQASTVPLLMICIKLSRQMNGYKRDNLVDIAGYALTAEMIEDAE